MEPESNNRITTSSNKVDATYLRSIDRPTWVSIPAEDNYQDATITVELPEQNYIKEVFVNNTQNIKNIIVEIYDSEENKVNVNNYWLN